MSSFIELEERVAYQDKTIADLDEVVRAFAARVEALEREVLRLRSAIVDAALPVGPAERPPHY